MNITPPFLPLSPGSNEPRKALAPVQGVAPTRDLVSEQRALAARLKVTEDDRRDAEKIVRRHSANVNVAAGLRASRALNAYQGVARRDEQDYVSSVLGIDEFA